MPNLKNIDEINITLIGICENLDLKRAELVKILKVCPDSFMSIHNKERMTKEQIDLSLVFIDLYVDIQTRIPSAKNQKVWLRSPNEKLDDYTPLEVLESFGGINRIKELLAVGIN